MRGCDFRTVHNPNVAAGVFEQPEYIFAESVPTRIDGLWTSVGELFGTTHLREAIKPMARCHPPFSGVILECNLIPAPSEIGDASGNIRSNCREFLTIKPMYELVADSAADKTKFAHRGFKDRYDWSPAKTIRFGIAGEPTARQLHRAIAGDPEIPIAVFSQRVDGETAEALSGGVASKRLPL